jgi:hypothetical protein
MSEILSGARYTLGGLLVLTLWSLCLVEFLLWKIDPSTDIPTYDQKADDSALLRFGPEASASEATVQRYHELRVAAGLE